jgi:AcrR family transcriptional regulator
MTQSANEKPRPVTTLPRSASGRARSNVWATTTAQLVRILAQRLPQPAGAAVAAEAGVTRLTVYRHFADLDALFAACRAHWSARNPRPDAAAWAAIPGLEERAQLALGELYGWYRDHADELFPINRDAGAMPLSAQRATETGNRMMAEALVAGHAGPDTDGVDGGGRLLRAVARHLVDFMTWRSLAIEQGLTDREAVDVAVRILTAIGSGGPRRRVIGPGS